MFQHTQKASVFSIYVPNSDGSSTQNLGFGFCKCHGEMTLRQVEQGFSSFFGIFEGFSNAEGNAKL